MTTITGRLEGDFHVPFSEHGGQPILSKPTHLEDYPGVKKQDANGLTVVLIFGEAFLRNMPYVLRMYVGFSNRNIGWTREYANQMGIAGLGMHDAIKGVRVSRDTIPLIMDNPNLVRQIPTAMLYRPDDFPPGRYVAMSAQRMYYPRIRIGNGPDQEEAVLHQVLRTVDSNYRHKGTGRKMTELAVWTHKDAKWLTHRSPWDRAIGINALLSLGQRVPIFDLTESFPFGSNGSELDIRLFPTDSHQWAIEQAMSRLLHQPKGVDRWGVCREVYKERNQNVDYGHKPEHPIMARVWSFMYRQRRMIEVDGMLPLYKIK